MRPKVLFSIFAFFVLMVTGQPLQAESTLKSTNSGMATGKEKVNYIFPANKDKAFDETVDEFYQALRTRKYPVHQKIYHKIKNSQHPRATRDLNTILFKEYPNASINFRKKVLFKEVEKFNYITWDEYPLYPFHTYPDIPQYRPLHSYSTKV
ncbi:hypothetical protein [Ectobacillus panaciterrae]|uniref:hypothetical protein n=1 Tax=Ectobacillus panaciterrae TaxID=363872 RepID=UPI00048B64C9|nr:hypothetical protein [Ectobacillus panaciterrae]